MRPTYQSESPEHFPDAGLRVNQLLGELPQETVQAFDDLKRTSPYPKGSLIFAEGQPPRGIYVLGQGRAKLVFDAGGKRERIIRVAWPGEVLGLSATIAGEPYEISVEALTHCRVEFVGREEFLRLLRERPDACFRVVQLLGRNLHVSYEHFRFLDKTPSAAAKLAHLLLGWQEEAGKGDDGVRLKIPLTHESIARLIGTSRETVTRTLGEFKSKRLINVEGSTLMILDRAALRALQEPNLKPGFPCTPASTHPKV